MNNFVPSIRIAFYLAADDFNLDEVTRRMGMTPDKARTRDDWPTEHYVKTVWSIETKEENCVAVCLLFEKFLDVLKGKEVIIKDICKDYNIEASFEIIIHCQDGNNPELVLTRDIISFAASIGAEIGFDIYSCI